MYLDVNFWDKTTVEAILKGVSNPLTAGAFLTSWSNENVSVQQVFAGKSFDEIITACTRYLQERKWLDDNGITGYVPPVRKTTVSFN